MTSLLLPGRFRAVLFDMDGLLIDSEPLWADAEGELLELHGDRLTEADRTATHGRAMADSAKVYAARLPGTTAAALEAELLELMRRRYLAGAPLHRGAAELVRALVGKVRLGVATSTTKPLVEVALEGVGLLDAFEIVSSGADLGQGKPDPRCSSRAADVWTRRQRTRWRSRTRRWASWRRVPRGCSSSACQSRPGVAPRLVDAGADLIISSLADVVVER
ncbi:MAG: HAD family phosphatase [Chloroflexota bacterium]